MITYQILEAKGACESQVSLFKELFLKGLTVETALSVADKFDFSWAAEALLSEEGRKAYDEAEAPLREAYEEAEAPLWKAYQEAKASLWEPYDEAEASLWKAYREVMEPLWKAYDEAEAPLRKVYKEACAKLFAELYLKENI